MNLCAERRLRHALLVAVAATLCVPLATARAEETKPATSLRMIPADAAFYATMLRNRKQFDAIVQSKAWAKLSGLPLYQFALKQLQEQLAKPDPQLATILKLYEMPENKQLLALLGEMVSDEVFLYGGDSFTSLLELLAKVNQGNQVGQLNYLLMKGGIRPGDGNNPAILQARILLNILRDNLKLLQTPELVIGFRVKDAKAAEAQLRRLEQVLEPLTEQVPQLKGRLNKVKVKGQTFLSLALDGKMVPWDQTPLRDVEEKEGDYDALLKKLSGMKLSISLGVRDKYLLLAIGESLDALDQLGDKGPKLASRPEFKPLARFADKPLCSIGYASKNLLARVTTSPEDIDGMADLAKGFLGNAPLSDAQRKRVARDIDGIAKDIKSILPEPGATVSFSYLTESGQEGFAYSWAKPAGKLEAAPLTLLNHVGGNPILALVGRSQLEVESYQTLVKWLKVIHGHVEEFALGQIPEEAKEAYEKFGKTFFPLLKRLDEITGKMLLPALADGQTAFVLDGKWKSKHWHMMVPATEAAMPLPELGLVLGVSDADLLAKAMSGYRKLINDTLEAAREMSRGQVPEIRVPPPESTEVQGGTLFFYPIPAILGLDKQVAPAAGLGKRVAVLALSQEHAERLLMRNPLQVEGGPLANAKRPLLGAVYFDWPALVDTAQPWIELGAQTALAQVAKEGGRPGKKEKAAGLTSEEIVPQVQTLLEVLKVYKVSTGATYLEDGVIVTHVKSIFKDLK